MLLVASVVLALAPAGATQDPPSTGMTTQDIVPQPNAGREPTEAGDRGGALQLLIPGVLIVAVGGAVVHLRRQSRQARYSAGSSASQAAVPSTKPDR